MPDYIKIPELLAPAGNYEKLETAIHYGADAVYLGGRDFSLRNFSGNFTDKELESAVYYAHKHNVKVYITCNIFSRNNEQNSICRFLETIGNLNPDAVIISDPGIIRISKQIIPHIDIHLSTQANTTNYNAVKFWEELGIKRVNISRELSLKEIKEIIQNSSIAIEAFVHGAMCISYSGRCLLSSFLTGRDSNRGLCSHPCRWNYSVVEEKRDGEYQPIMEDSRGTYIFNSKDLCMIDYIPELCDAGISSFKLEGRMKGISYLASVVKIYREAIDLYAQTLYSQQTEHNAASLEYNTASLPDFNNSDDFNKKELTQKTSSNVSYSDIKASWYKELSLVYNRTYCNGFYFNDPDQVVPNYSNLHKGNVHSFIGKIIKSLPDDKIVVQIKNKVSVGDIIEMLPPKGGALQSVVVEISDQNNYPAIHAQPNSTSILKLDILDKTSSDVDKTFNIVRKIS